MGQIIKGQELKELLTRRPATGSHSSRAGGSLRDIDHEAFDFVLIAQRQTAQPAAGDIVHRPPVGDVLARGIDPDARRRREKVALMQGIALGVTLLDHDGSRGVVVQGEPKALLSRVDTRTGGFA